MSHHSDNPGSARIYLDANASEILRPEARAALLAALGMRGNPASVHADGRGARRLLEDARDAVAAAFATAPEQVVFTSGGTEANALAIHGLAAGRRLLMGATEHDAVRAACGRDATILPVRPDGTCDLADLERALADGPPALVCLMAANNETGVLHPITEAAAICRRHGAWLHVDAVQAAGRLPVAPDAIGAASVAVSAHKMGGVPGAGALLLAGGIEPAPLFAGGGQEWGRRGGTPALAPIAAFAAVAGIAAPAHLAALRDRIEAAAAGAGAVVHGAAAPRLANTTCLGLPGRAAARQLMALDLAGFAVSAGAACSSGKVARSHVLAAMGAGAGAGEAIRVSLSWSTTAEDASRFVDAYLRMAHLSEAGGA